MALTKIDVNIIKDGTDGQVITWDADAKATTTGPGTATQVLTSKDTDIEETFRFSIGTTF